MRRSNNYHEVDSKYSWFIAVLASFSLTLSLWFFRVYGVLFVAIIDTFDCNRREGTWPLTAFLIASFLVGPIAGYLGHITNVRVLLLSASIVSNFAVILLSFSQTVFQLSAACAVLGCCTGFPMTLLGLIVAPYFQRKRTAAMGILLGGPSLASFIFPYGIRYLLNLYGLQGCFLICGALQLHTIPCAYLLFPFQQHHSKKDQQEKLMIKPKLAFNNTENKMASQNRFHHIFYVLTLPWWYIIGFTLLFHAFLNTTFLNVIVDFGQDHRISSSIAVVLITVFSVGDVIGRLCTGWIIDRGFMKASSCIAFGSFLLSVMFILITFARGVWLVGLLTVGIGFVLGYIVILFPTVVCDYIGVQYLGVVTGWHFFGLGVILSPRALIIGFFRDTLGSYDLLFILFGVAAIITSCLWIFIRVKTNSLACLALPTYSLPEDDRASKTIEERATSIASLNII